MEAALMGGKGAGGMKLRKLYIQEEQQFRDVLLDFTHPDTGEPLNRVCLIGRNGTGKSTILRWLADTFRHPRSKLPRRILWTLQDDAGLVLFWSEGRPVEVESDAALRDASGLVGSQELGRVMGGEGRGVAQGRKVQLRADSDLLVFSAAESATNAAMTVADVPATRLDDALKLAQTPEVRHEVSNAHVDDMWKRLVYFVKQRESDRQAYETRPENLEKTKAQLIREFDAANPPVLEALGELWNRILEPTGLVFDVENAKLPIQLTDNLEAYVKVAASGRRVPYNALSTGIRNFLFHVGHLFLLFFNRSYESAFVFIDEPENSLFPDFLYELMEIYEAIIGPDTQLFVATHNPIVAAQFEPHERIVLEWDDTAHVTAKRGVAPKGDDPNDVLQRDFHVSQLMGPAGRQAYRRYRELRKQIRRLPQAPEVEVWVDEANALARDYGFPP